MDEVEKLHEDKLIRELLHIKFIGKYRAIALARFVMRREIEARLETHKEYNNPTLTCNCLNHSNRRLAELRRELSRLEGEK